MAEDKPDKQDKPSGAKEPAAKPEAHEAEGKAAAPKTEKAAAPKPEKAAAAKPEKPAAPAPSGARVYSQGELASPTVGQPEPKAKPATKDEPAAPQRRAFLGLSSLGVAWVAFAAAMGACTAGMGRFFFPNVLYEPPASFKAGRPSEYPTGVDERWKARYGTWIVRVAEGFFALKAVCTHLGCTPNWLSAEQKFKCPCHGSGFYMSGINFEGPAPRPLERYRITMSDDGQIVVDRSRIYQQEKGQWSDPDSFLGYTAAV